MNYEQQIQEIEKKVINPKSEREYFLANLSLLTLAKKMQEQIEAQNTRLMELQSTINYCNDYKIPKWILCSERLPEKKGLYLVTKFQEGYISEHSCVVKIVFFDPQPQWESDSYKTLWKEWGILAWMLLPEPFKEST
jgi:Protein of unknown function (DUF551)